MANVIRIKRRAANGAAGAPSSLKNAELAFNEADQKLYYGKGADGSGNATEIIAIGGVGWDSSPDLSGYGALASNNTWTGNNTFNGTVNLESTFQIDAVSVTTSAAELNLLDGALADTVVNSKAVIYGSAGEVSVTTLTIGGTDVTSTAAELNLLDGSVADTVVNSKAVIYGSAGEVSMTTLTIGGTDVTATATELNVLDGITASTAELNILDGVTADYTELNVLDGITASTAELNILDGVTSSTAELNILDGVTSSAAELNLVDGSVANTVVNSKAVVYGSAGEVAVTTLAIGGTTVTSTAAELNILDGVTADKDEINLLDGAAANTVVNSKAVVYGSAGEVAAATISTTGNVTVGGDLTVNGTTVTVNAETVEVEDKNIVLGKVATPTDTTADGGGLTLKGSTDKTFNWVNSTDAWTSSEHVELAAGKQVVLGGSTSGKVTIAVPAVAGTHTATLPAATGTVVLDSTVCTAIADCSLDGGTF